jgi:hypothetical protein
MLRLIILPLILCSGCISTFEEKIFPPTLNLVSPVEGEVYNQGEQIAFEVAVSNPDDSSFDLVVWWQSEVDGFLVESGPDAEGGLKLYSSLSAGEHLLTTSVSDVKDLYIEEILQLWINILPSAISA